MTMIIDGSNGVTFPNSTIQASAGQVLQVVSATYGTQVTTTATSYSDTGLTATITPKFATSKILVLVSQNGLAKNSSNAGSAVNVKLLRNSTDLSLFAIAVTYTGASGTLYSGASSVSYLDSPATTSATTYKTQFGSNSSGGNIYVQIENSTSTITLLEIAQ